MKAKAQKTFWHKHRKVNKGDVLELDTTDGKKLISYKLVKEEKVAERKTKEQK